MSARKSTKTVRSVAPFCPVTSSTNKVISMKAVAAMLLKRGLKKNTKKLLNPKDVIKFAWVDWNLIDLDYDRQRYPEPAHIEDIVVNWDSEVMTPLQAIKMADGRYKVSDGQQHGLAYMILFPNSPVPVCYVETDDPNVITKQLLALNAKNKPVAKYFIHMNYCKTGDKEAIDIETAVLKAGCTTSYKGKTPGAITHITDLYAAKRDYGTRRLIKVLSRHRLTWPLEKISTSTMQGFLKVTKMLDDEGIYSDELLDDIFLAMDVNFLNSERVHLDIKDDFKRAYPSGHKGISQTEKVASGMIDVYERAKGQKLLDKPIDIRVNIMVTSIA